MKEQFEFDLVNNKLKLEKKPNEPILKFAENTKICYVGPEKKAESYKEKKKVMKVILDATIVKLHSMSL